MQTSSPFPGGGGRGGGGWNSSLTSAIVIVALVGAVIVLAGIAVLSWLVIRRMRKKKAPEKPVDSAPQEQPKAG